MTDQLEDTQSHEGADDAMDTSESSTSTLSSPLQVPDQLYDEDEQDTAGEVKGEGMESDGDEEDTVDLKKMAEDYARYLVVNSKQDTQQLDERIESVVFRVDEFKQQLSHMHQNITSSSDKMRQLHENTQQLKDLFSRIDQVEAFLNLVSKNVDQLEDTVSKAEKELDPSKLRKVFSALPFRRSSSKSEAPPSWQPPKVLRSRDYFTSNSASLSTSPPPTQGQRSKSEHQVCTDDKSELEKKVASTGT